PKRLKASSPKAYSFQVCSTRPSTPLSRRRNFSRRPKRRGNGGRSASKTLYIYAPSGLGVANITTAKTPIWIQPMAVSADLEFFRAKQCVYEITGQQN